MSDKIELAVIGGSGLYDIEASLVKEIESDTPFGKPSSNISIFDIDGTKIAFIARHGKGHTILPSEIPAKANIYALKSLGVRRIIAISAVGSLKEEIAPRDFVIPSQIIDNTKARASTFFGEGIVGHVSFADPFCLALSKIIYETALSLSLKVHKDATYICMEGPAFSTRAESMLYKKIGADVIGMTAIPEAKLAREAEICYAMTAMSTDYDSWREGEEDVSSNMVVQNMNANIGNIKKLLPKLIKNIDGYKRECECERACEHAVMTNMKTANLKTKEKLSVFYSKYEKSF